MSFRPATPRADPSQQPGTLTTVCHCLTFKEDDEEEEDKEEEDTEHFPTASLNDDVWITYAFMKIPNMICVLTLAHKVWISYTLLWITHYSTWTSVTLTD